MSIYFAALTHSYVDKCLEGVQPVFNIDQINNFPCNDPTGMPNYTPNSCEIGWPLMSMHCSIVENNNYLCVPSSSTGPINSMVDAPLTASSVEMLDDSFSSPSSLSTSYSNHSFLQENPVIMNDLTPSQEDPHLFAFPSSPASSCMSDSWLSPTMIPCSIEMPHSSMNSPCMAGHMMDQHLVIASPEKRTQSPSHLNTGNRRRSKVSKNKSRLHTCPHCPHTSNRANNMKEHIRTHDPNRPKNFACSVCEKKFARKHDMKRHEKSHKRSHGARRDL